MKRLTKMRLINWHYFENETIDFKGSALITGDNGSGKSTILDAIQFVLTCGAVNFNSAAHEDGKRNLMGYVRCKTGKDEKVYDRQGDITAHIALEFVDDETSNFFVLGAVIDSYDTLSKPETIYYFIDNTKIQNSIFVDEKDIVLNIGRFKTGLGQFEKSKFEKNKHDAAGMFLNKLGGIDKRFPALLSKSLAFKAMKDVRTFVYLYLLDEKTVDIKNLKENIQSFMALEKLLNTTKKQLERLEEITNNAEEIYNLNKVIKQHEYIIERAKLESTNEEAQKNQLDLKDFEGQKGRREDRKKSLQKSIDKIDEDISQIDHFLATNEAKILIENIERTLNDLREKKRDEDFKKDKFLDVLKKEQERAKNVYDIDKDELYKDFYKKVSDESYLQDVDNFIKVTNLLVEKYEKLREMLFNKKAELSNRKVVMEKQLEELEKIIHNLKNKKLTYGKHTEDLIELLKIELNKEFGKNVEVRVLCELIEITDEVWRDAIEGYLNTQKFNIIVEPEYYDASLHVYEKYKNTKGIFGVGLVNTGALKLDSVVSENTLADMITSKNIYARQYVNMLLGQVVRVVHIDELKNYKISITATCMLYKNFTARQINPDAYKIPYIGEKAYKVQLEKREEECADLKGQLQEIEKDINLKNGNIEVIKRHELHELERNISCFEELARIKSNIAENQSQLDNIDKTTIMSKQLDQEELKRQKVANKVEIEKIDEKIGDIREEVGKINSLIVTNKDEIQKSMNTLKWLKGKNETELLGIEERFEKETQNKKYKDIVANFDNSKKGNETKRDNRSNALMALQGKYNSDYEFGAAVGTESINQYHSESEKLRNSTILEYEEQIVKAKETAEYEFKEHFILKLRENILNAKREYKKLNQALKGISFGKDEYSFSIEKSKEFEKIYDMVMDESNMGQDTIFSFMFKEKHKEAIDELFSRISSDYGDHHEELEKFTDYRTYMEYDIKIIRTDGTYSFSKICREKSGGETQTPYYVTIGASLKQLYTSARQDSTIGLMLLDEAFEKLDEEHIKSMMEFLNNLELQVILAVPTQSADHIIPYVQTTVLVENDGNAGYTDSIHKLKI